MKQCPACKFTFADFHRVCVFDGAELVQFERPQALMKVSPPPIRPRRSLRPLMSLTSLAVLAVFVSAVLIGYLKSPNPLIPAVVVQERGTNSVSSSTTQPVRTAEVSSESKANARATRARGSEHRRIATFKVPAEVTRVVSRSSSPTIARQRQAPQTSRTYPANATLARQREVQPKSSEKSPKVVAILKTTWRFLKKPF